MGKPNTHNPTYCVKYNWGNWLYLRYILDRMYLTNILEVQHLMMMMMMMMIMMLLLLIMMMMTMVMTTTTTTTTMMMMMMMMMMMGLLIWTGNHKVTRLLGCASKLQWQSEVISRANILKPSHPCPSHYNLSENLARTKYEYKIPNSVVKTWLKYMSLRW